MSRTWHSDIADGLQSRSDVIDTVQLLDFVSIATYINEKNTNLTV